jgi:hypothetical protein
MISSVDAEILIDQLCLFPELGFELLLGQIFSEFQRDVMTLFEEILRETKKLHNEIRLDFCQCRVDLKETTQLEST